ncbi:MFS transporter [Paracraurococcus lichenis]|uniref:MFS transporter n=1 Tax=Paracraurococcus lichenis TaxID=3064888 RepID=A0ABT9E8W3_9PROT|nr:MFS transporter [Paracraurococcus sp. LOR1-02]MDO9712641.1 MFS transporter [Paracraurococcus sp. LOR1-02]
MDARWQALAVLTAARTSLGVQFQSLASASPQLVGELGLSYADLGTLIGLYFLPGIVIALPGGALGRRFGDRRVVLAGLLLMALGGVVASLATGFAGLAAGRLLSGIGAVLLNVLMSKMVTDWFAGREIVLAMAVFVNSFPVGIGIAVVLLGWVSAAAGWPAALAASTGFALAALLLLLLGYRKHPRDGAGADAAVGRIPAADAALVSLAGAIWGLYNGAFAVMTGFAPTYLGAAGLAPAEAALLTGTATWLVVLSIQAGGLAAQRWGRPGLLMAAGVLAWAACLAAIAARLGPPAAAMVAAGLLMGLPVGVIMAQPAQALRPEDRAFGMGVFYAWLYVGHAGLPALAGWVQDLAGSPMAAPSFAAALVLAILPLYAALRAGLARRRIRLALAGLN